MKSDHKQDGGRAVYVTPAHSENPKSASEYLQISFRKVDLKFYVDRKHRDHYDGHETPI